MWVERQAEVPEALVALGLPPPRPVLVLVGGAANLDPGLIDVLGGLFGSLAPRLERAGAAVIDGATAYGVMVLMGQARSRTGARFPLVGVAAAGTVDVPSLTLDGPRGDAALDPDHSHFILVPGDRWGDESPWISACAAALAGPRTGLTLVVAGGAVTRFDVAQALAAGRPLLTLAGSGGTADLVAAWCRDGGPAPDPTLDAADRALVRVLELGEPGSILDLISRRLGS